MKQDLDSHAAELQHLADTLTRATIDPPSRKKRDKLLATLAPALASAAEKAQRLRKLYAQQAAVIGDAKRDLSELRQVFKPGPCEPMGDAACGLEASEGIVAMDETANYGGMPEQVQDAQLAAAGIHREDIDTHDRPRYHSGGPTGLLPGEIPVVLSPGYTFCLICGGRDDHDPLCPNIGLEPTP